MKIRKAEILESIQRRSAINAQVREDKNALHSAIAEDIERFIASGGQINQLAPTATTFLPQDEFVKKQRERTGKAKRQPFVINPKNHKAKRRISNDLPALY